MSFSVTIAKRGLKLGIVYVAMGGVIVFLAILLSGVGGVFGRTAPPVASPVDVNTYLSLMGIALLAMGGLLASTPVSLLFVHDKENGTLEYLLSMGFDQRGIFRAYLEASLILGAPLVVVGAAVASVVDLALGLGWTVSATVLVCALALGLAGIALVAVFMSAFTALQKQPMGMNQPMGIALGVFVVFAAALAPMAVPSFRVVAELALSGVVAAVSLILLALTPKLIRREKMLP